MRTVYVTRPKIDELPSRKRENFPDLARDTEFWPLYEVGKKYSLVHVTGFFNVYSALKYVASKKIPGDFVECGVWMGGVSIFACLMLSRLAASNRRVHLYDTFTGFPEGESDVKLGVVEHGRQHKNFRDSVEGNLVHEGASNYRIVEGPVESTLVAEPLPETIAVLRLDTDYYNSTKAELEQLYPKLSVGGVLIVDDYGYYEGSRRACDEYFGDSMFWTRIDPGIRCGIKTQ